MNRAMSENPASSRIMRGGKSKKKYMRLERRIESPLVQTSYKYNTVKP
jgi:hypothetical protein